jgi:Flp pilus assembly CpaF family ATPase
MSFAWSEIKNPSEEDVDKYFKNQCKLNRISSSTSRKIYTKNDKVMAKTIYKYENGLEQINKTLENLGISSIKINAKEKMYGNKPKEIKPSDIFKSRHINIIYKDWSWEIDKFDYDLR